MYNQNYVIYLQEVISILVNTHTGKVYQKFYLPGEQESIQQEAENAVTKLI
jgi:hypothetical protein